MRQESHWVGFFQKKEGQLGIVRCASHEVSHQSKRVAISGIVPKCKHLFDKLASVPSIDPSQFRVVFDSTNRSDFPDVPTRARSSFRNVLRNRRRSLLTLASTAVSLALLALLWRCTRAFFTVSPPSPSEALRLICRHRVSLTQPLPASHYAAASRAVPGVDEISAWTWFQGVYKEPKNFFARFAVDPDTIFKHPQRLGRCPP